MPDDTNALVNAERTVDEILNIKPRRGRPRKPTPPPKPPKEEKGEFDIKHTIRRVLRKS
jgi:hypothetical protein